MTNPSNDIPPSPRVKRELLVQGANFNYERLTVERTQGKPLVRDIVRHPGAVLILPILATPQGTKVVLIKNWRASVERWIYELPAGTLEAGEDPKDCAARELEEETGYSAATIIPLCRFYTSPGLSDELMWAFAATDLKPVGQILGAMLQVPHTDVVQVRELTDDVPPAAF